MKFSDELAARLPAGMTLPPAFVQVMDALEARGLRVTEREGEALPFEEQSLELDTPPETFDGSTTLAAFHWYAHEPSNRLCLFVRTGGDGSYAGLWLDDEGQQHLVHRGSGSGSVWFGVLPADPLVLLRLLAIGYSEPAFEEVHAGSLLESLVEDAGHESLKALAAEVAEEMLLDADDTDDLDAKIGPLAASLVERMQRGGTVHGSYPVLRPPAVLREVLAALFGVDVPERGTDLVTVPEDGSEEARSDPFATWLVENTEDADPELTDAMQEFLADLESDEFQALVRDVDRQVEERD